MQVLVSCGISGGAMTLCSVGVGLITVCLFLRGLRHPLLLGFLLELLEHFSMLLISSIEPIGSPVSHGVQSFAVVHLSFSTTHQLVRHLSKSIQQNVRHLFLSSPFASCCFRHCSVCLCLCLCSSCLFHSIFPFLRFCSAHRRPSDHFFVLLLLSLMCINCFVLL